MKKLLSFIVAACMFLNMGFALADNTSVPRADTPDYNVAFYAFDCYNMQDEYGKRSGYGYEMMQDISDYMQCTFSYVGYDKSAEECVNMLRRGELDLYTAAKITPEREAEFIFSTHPAITASTCMNVKVGDNDIVAGDYSTYEGMRIGLLARHTYNSSFLKWANEKGFAYEIKYYETQTELSNALVDNEVDALVNSYIRTPEDERTIENFGETPYYIMARKEDKALIDAIDAAIDRMNIENPNWRADLYNMYYGTQSLSTQLTDGETELLDEMQRNNVVIRAVVDPDSAPYSFYNDGEAGGIAVDIFKATAEYVALNYEIIPAATHSEYIDIVTSGNADIWIDADEYMDTGVRYKITDPYMDTSISIMRVRGATSKINRIAAFDYDVYTKEILAVNWPNAEVIAVNNVEQCISELVSGNVDGALMYTYTAQKVARDDVQNRFRVDIVPGASVSLRMGVNAEDDYNFYGIWSKALSIKANEERAEIVQKYVEEASVPNIIAYLFDHPTLMFIIIAVILLIVFLLLLYLLSVRSKHKQKKIMDDLEVALKDAEEANAAKNDFFSKMSHDIRTPLNVVLGMTQIAQKYKDDPARLSDALDSIDSEGNYLLMLLNSILDVNQLEHGHMELNNTPFNPAWCVHNSIDALRTLADKKEQHITVSCNRESAVVVGDANRFSQIIINIVSNAIKYTDNGGKIDVKLECLENNVCRFICSDNGIGMTPEFLEHITEDYVRAEDSRVSKTHGTGLGMSVVKGFTDLMHGSLHIESTLGKGSTFTIELPFAEATPEQRDYVMAPHTDGSDNSRTRFNGKLVLLAEDNELNAEIAIELLQMLGLSVDWAENGAVALEKFEKSQLGEYFAVFMDMQMPVMDGIEATLRIRSSKREDHTIPIFAMTANTFASDKKRCRDAGMSGYIAKPIDVETIATTLEDNT